MENPRDYDDYEVWLEEIWNKFIEDMRVFAKEGDERDSYPEFSTVELSLVMLENDDESLNDEEKEKINSRIHEYHLTADKIDTLASTHQNMMQQHASGSDYHIALGEFEASIGL